MSNDLISRSDLIKALNEAQVEFDEYYKGLGKAKVITDNAPTVDIPDLEEYEDMANALNMASELLHKRRQQGKWIPVSERMPKEEDYRPCWGLPDGCVMWQTDNGDIGFGWYYDSTKCWSDIYDHPIKTGEIIAWQPLPEPYDKGEEK